MANNRIAHTEWEINYHNEIIDDLNEYVAKANALIEVVLNCDLSKVSHDSLRHYLLELETLLRATKIVCRDIE